MELVYFWASCSSNGFIKNQGFNFYGEHKFSMEEANGKWRLSYERIEAVRGSRVYKGTGVCNISAIVGENGSGKSSLLQSLIHKNIFLNSSLKPQDGSTQHPINVSVVMNERGTFEIYHNFKEEQLDISIQPKEIYEENFPSLNDQAQCIGQFDNLFTTAYVTNASNPPFNAVNTREHVKEIALTERTVDIIWNGLLSKMCRKEETGAYVVGDPVQSLYQHLKGVISSDVKCGIFDVLYFHTVKSKKLSEFALAKICSNLKVYATFYQINESQIFNKDFSFLRDKDSMIANLYICLFLEWVDFWKIDKNKIIDTSESTLFSIVEELDFPTEGGISGGQYLAEDLEHHKEHYRNAVQEVIKMEAIFKKGILQDNKWAETDRAYKKWVNFDLLQNADAYWEFCKFVSDCAVAEYSFVLKYLVIDGIYLSSGERAIQNLFSWVNLLPIFEKITGDSYKSLNKHLLLLIDEVDLYVHPEWQRQLISHLITQVNEQFPDNKVQIILTTHSPFVLSDIPVENCIFLEPEEKDGERIFAISKTANVSAQTFAANLHLTVRSKFFMSSTMGVFAEKTTAQIINELENELNQEEMKDELWYLTMEGLIQTIREDLYRNELWKRYRRIPHVEKRNETLEFSGNLKKVKNYLDSLDEISRTRFLTELDKQTGANYWKKFY